MDAGTRRAIVDTVAANVEAFFVFPEIGAEMAVLVRSRLEGGEYDNAREIEDLVSLLNDDLLSVYPDGHLRVDVLKQRTSAADRDDVEGWTNYVEEARYHNFGFNRVERLEGNIGYLELDRLYHGSISAEAAIGAMAFLQNTDALIIDLRSNPGGRDDVMQLLFSYFFDEDVHYATSTYRHREVDRQWWTGGYVPGKRLPEIPIYILAGANTGSAAEQFAYTLKHLGRAVVVGERTAGAAHTTHIYEFPEVGIEMFIPDGTTVSPVTGADWEGEGVIPDIETSAEGALEVAHAEALERLLEVVRDEPAAFRLKWAKAEVDARARPVVLTPALLEDYVGTYGPRQVFVESDRLFYRREGRPGFRLLPIGDDYFMLEGLDYFRIRFERDESGRVVELIGIYDDGTEDRSRRTR
jgi:hypothetical protein